MIRFSIIIPTYNRAHLIEKALHSALNQKYNNFEIIVVDDGSSDNTTQVVNSIKSEKIKYFKIINSERGAARNYGIKKSSGDYITFLDSDDHLYENYLLFACESINKFQFPAFFHLAYEIHNANKKTTTRINFLKSDNIYFLANGNPLGCLGVFVRKDVFAGFLFNENRDLAGSEDWELWLRIASNFGFKCDNRIAACLMNHHERSVLGFPMNKLIKRKELSLKYAFEDEMVLQKFRQHKRKMESYCDSYIALHLILSKHSIAGIKFFINSLVLFPPSLFTKRTLGIMKRLIF